MLVEGSLLVLVAVLDLDWMGPGAFFRSEVMPRRKSRSSSSKIKYENENCTS